MVVDVDIIHRCYAYMLQSGSGDDMELSFDSGRLIYDTNELRKEILNILGLKPMLAHKIISEIIRRNKIHFRYGFNEHERRSLAARVTFELRYLVASGLVMRISGKSQGFMYYRKL